MSQNATPSPDTLAACLSDPARPVILLSGQDPDAAHAIVRTAAQTAATANGSALCDLANEGSISDNQVGFLRLTAAQLTSALMVIGKERPAGGRRYMDELSSGEIYGYDILPLLRSASAAPNPVLVVDFYDTQCSKVYPDSLSSKSSRSTAEAMVFEQKTHDLDLSHARWCIIDDPKYADHHHRQAERAGATIVEHDTTMPTPMSAALANRRAASEKPAAGPGPV